MISTLSMSTPSELQSLLRFLSKDAKLPLATAMGKVKELQKAELTRWVAFSVAKLPDVSASKCSDLKIICYILNFALSMRVL